MILRRLIAEKVCEKRSKDVMVFVSAYLVGHIDDRELILSLEAIFDHEAESITMGDFQAAFLTQLHKQ